jgi:creatinine deaminase
VAVDDAAFLQEALREAERGGAEGGIPIGAVLVRGGAIIARGHNRRVQDGDHTAHAEIDCLRRAGRQRTLRDTVLYSTLMPCYLCAGAVVQFRIPRVVVGESRTFAGARAFLEAHGVAVVDRDDPRCVALMQAFIAANPELWAEDIGE